jgi:hypothetical protein
MISSRRGRAISLIFVACVLMIACTRFGRSSSTEDEIRELRTRSIPDDGQLIAFSNPVKTQSSIRATWEVRTGSNGADYFRWLGKQLGAQYHVTSQGSSRLTFVKQMEGDSYSVEANNRATPSDTVVDFVFIAIPD